ncbi:MAG TPA: hypothetical protein VNT03_09685 [Baekduia sp.]|nr:hypothetical protein [Baekduia sp.]
MHALRAEPELAERARTIRPDLKVLVMSGYIHQMIAQADPARAPDIAFIEKPFTAEALLTGVRTALDRAAGTAPTPPD